MYRQGEIIFATFGSKMVSDGWSLFPQERAGKRQPGRVSGVTLKWKDFQHRLPTAEEVNLWSLECPGHNVAVITGVASSNLFALDVDVSDEKLAWHVRELADEFLGVTPFKRIGRAPRIVLLYRIEEGVDLKKRTYRFVEPGEAGEVKVSEDNALEILANGSPFTAYGKHHKTGSYFSWIGSGQPLVDPPTEAPLVSADQLTAFLMAVQEKRAFYKSAPSLTTTANFEYDSASGLQVPRLKGMAVNWAEDSNGLVIDGREEFLFRLVGSTVYSNPAAARGGAAGEAQIMAMVAQLFRTQAAMTGRWDETHLRNEVAEKVRRECQRVIDNNLPGLVTRIKEGGRTDETGKVVETVAVQRLAEILPPTRATVVGHDSLSFIKVADSLAPVRERNAVRIAYVSNGDPDAALRESRKLVPDRTQIADKVKVDIMAALDAFFDDVYTDMQGASRIHVLKAPTGAGKTTHTIRRVGEDPRTKRYDAARAAGEETPGPVLFLLPTYNNIEELRLRANVLNLDGKLDDADLEQQARDRGLIKEDELDARVADLRRDAMDAGLKSMTYKGKLAAGCQMVDKMKLLMDAGIGTSGLCKSVKKDAEGKPETIFCDFYAGCPAIEQRKAIAESHVVFLPHAFLTLSIPDELKTVRAVIADERVFHLFVHTTSFFRATLNLPRKKPTLTTKERRALKDKEPDAIEPEDLMTDRDVAASRAASALSRRECPALVLSETLHEYPNGKKVSGLELVRHAKRVCGNALTSGTEITPETSVRELQEMCQVPTGTEVREEWRFWAIIEERIEALQQDAIHAGMVAKAKENHAERVAEARRQGLPEPEDRTAVYEAAWKRKGKGARESRIQFLLEEVEEGQRVERIRLSWRSQPNWASSPLLLLDASASPDIIGKIFNEREVVVHDVEAPLNVRTVVVVDQTYSNFSIVSGAGRTSMERLAAGRLKDSLRCVISTVSAQYGWGRVVCGSSVVVRKAINEAWKQPTNVDWCHFGAMRGLDFAKHHAAAVSIGRMEVPIKVIDGLVAALTYDDDEPETPYDVNGDDVGPDGKSLRLPSEPQVMKMRSGHDISVPVPRFPGAWARKVQEQYREEELSQFLGRLRPVYREGEAPVWFAISKVVPSHVIVDDVVTIQDILAKHDKGRFMKSKLWDAVRMADGIVHPELLAAANPTLYKGVGAVVTEMAEHGLDADTGRCDMSVRASWGFTPVQLTNPGTRERTWAYVRTDIRDPATAVSAAFAKYADWSLRPEHVEVGTPTRPAIASGQRVPDWVDEQIGHMDDRSDAEYVTLGKAASWAVENFPVEAFLEPTGITQHLPVGVRQTNENGHGTIPLTLRDIAATCSTDAMWAKVKEGHMASTAAKITEPAATYDHLADGSHDADDEGGDMARFPNVLTYVNPAP